MRDVIETFRSVTLKSNNSSGVDDVKIIEANKQSKYFIILLFYYFIILLLYYCIILLFYYFIILLFIILIF